MVRALTHGGYHVVHERVDGPLALTAALERQSWDIAIADYTMAAFPPARSFDLLRQRDADLPFIFVSGTSRRRGRGRGDADGRARLHPQEPARSGWRPRSSASSARPARGASGGASSSASRTSPITTR